jgi:hypothetical protein
MVWIKNSRHLLPIGKCDSHEAVGGLCRRDGLQPVVDGIPIATMTAISADTITGRTHHDAH